MMRIYPFFFALLAAIVWSGSLAAQAPATPTSPNKPEKMPRYELVYDLLWLIDKNTFPPTSLMVRYHFRQTATHGMALRVRVGGEYDRYHSFFKKITATPSAAPDSFYTTNTSASVQTRAGLEWQRKWTKFQLNYGVEGDFSYRLEKTEQEEFSTTNRVIVSKGYTKIPFVSLVALIGFKIPVWKRISIYGETNFSAGVKRWRNLDKAWFKEDYPNGANFSTSQSNYNQVLVNTQLLSALGISFTF